MYRFEFLSKKDCFKLKLIAPKSSSVLPRTIFGWPSTEFFFLVIVAPHPRTHTSTLRPFHIRRTQAVLGIYGGHEDSNGKDTVYCTFVWTHRERQNGTQYDLWAYIILVTYGDVFSAPKRAHTIYSFGFEFHVAAAGCCYCWKLCLSLTPMHIYILCVGNLLSAAIQRMHSFISLHRSFHCVRPLHS